MQTNIEDTAAFFLALGGMHDARFHVSANPSDKTLMIDVDDINSSTLDLPEYPGKQKSTFTFSKVTNVCMDYEIADSINSRIYDIKIQSENNSFASKLTMLISPGGKLVFDFSTVRQE